MVLGLAEKAELEPDVKQAGQSASPLCQGVTGLDVSMGMDSEGTGTLTVGEVLGLRCTEFYYQI